MGAAESGEDFTDCLGTSGGGISEVFLCSDLEVEAGGGLTRDFGV